MKQSLLDSFIKKQPKSSPENIKAQPIASDNSKNETKNKLDYKISKRKGNIDSDEEQD